MKPNPPKGADLFLKMVCSPHLLEEIQGDLYERYEEDLTSFGKKVADRQYAQNVAGFLRLRFGFKYAGFSTSVRQKSNEYSKPLSTDMIKNYLKISTRNLWRNRVTSAVGITGLSVGLASGLVIFLLVSYIFSFNRFHTKTDRIFWIVTSVHHENVTPSDAVPMPLGEVLRKNYSFVESAVRLTNVFGKIITIQDRKTGLTKKFEESRNICFTEPQYFDVFDSKWAFGNIKTALEGPNTVVLSEQYAEKYFGTANALGRILKLDNKTDLTVTGIIKNPPSNTQLRYDVLVSYSSMPGFFGNADLMNQWAAPITMCWVALRKDVPTSQLSNALNVIRKKYLSAEDYKRYEFDVIPLTEMFHHPLYGPAPRPILYALVVIGIFLVLASCINFINLSTARALRRSKEVGVRKTMGSSRRQLIGQFMTETTIVALLATVVALILAQLNLPFVNNALSMLHADISILDLVSPNAVLWLGSLIGGVILLTGFYPSLILARFNPVAALRGSISMRQVGKISVRKGLVVVQFFITQLFIIGVIVVSSQVRYIRNKDLGFRKDATLIVPLPSGNALRQETARKELSELKGVEQIAFGGELPFAPHRPGESFTFDTHAEKEKFQTKIRIGDKNYVPLFGLKLIAGRNFLNNDTTSNEALVNEVMVKQLGFRSASEVLGKRISFWGMDMNVVGVVADFHLDELKSKILPATVINYYKGNSLAAIRLNKAGLSESLIEVEKTWNKIFPESVYKAGFADEKIAESYMVENIILGLIEVFSVIAILIGCLGLFGLVTFMADAKTKEIGIRKVMGASSNELFWIFGGEFGKLLLFGFLIAGPLGGFLMNGWLQSYAYRINLGWWIFILTILIVAAITALTVSFQSLKAIRMNPVKSLRSE